MQCKGGRGQGEGGRGLSVKQVKGARTRTSYLEKVKIVLRDHHDEGGLA